MKKIIKNKKGNIFLKIIIILFIWINGILMIPFLTDDIDTSRSDLSCSTTTISFGTKTLCLTIDLVIPMLIWTLVVIILGLMVG
jgi:hypothetical protein